MYAGGLRPDRKHQKSAAAVGDVMGKFHPHGDQAIYDALARMAQDFSLRYPLVDGHGNFGSPDPNDRPAAMRYTEARLAPLAMQLLGEIDEDTVNFVPTYDGNTEEPVVLPARFPNLLVNGGGGIAVGMATNIPPHNLGEVIDAVNHVLDHPDATPDDLMQFVHGPDFPTGALILGKSGIHDAYRTGRGSIKMRAVAEIEEARQGMRIVVTEVPYQTSVEVIGQKIAELVNDRKIEGIRDVRNESSGDTVRLVVELKRDANAQVVLNQLYKHTPMQTNFPVHMLALVDGVPQLLDLAKAIKVYVMHQMEVVQRRTEYRLRKAQERTHIVEGLVKALDMIDAIIALIRGAADVETARRAHGEAVQFQRDPGQLHPRHAAAPAHPARGAEAPRGARRAAGHDRRAELDPQEPEEAAHRHQGRARGRAREARRRAPHQAHPRRRRPRRARPHRRRRGRGRPLQQGLHQDGRGRRVPSPRSRWAGCAAAICATKTSSSTCSPPPRTRTSCSSRTAGSRTACARTRSR